MDKEGVNNNLKLIIGGVVALALLLALLVLPRGSSETSYDKTLNKELTQRPRVERSADSSIIPDYLDVAFDELIESEQSFLSIDLTNLKIDIYEEGLLSSTVTIRAVASETSWWQTAPGYYEIISKISEHSSSFGNVIMPWNMPFQGNFFIHGWPRYPSGAPATSAVSGGCIRLAEEDAEAIFNAFPIGTTIISRDDKYRSNLNYNLIAEDIESVDAEAYLAVDLSNNEILFASNESIRKDVGDLGILLSALTASEHIGMESQMWGVDTLDDNGRVDNEVKYRLFDILFPLLEDWSHEPETTFASYMGEERFDRRLVYKARAVGMNNTHTYYDESRGTVLEATPLDMVNLSRYIHLYRDFIFDITKSDIIFYLYGYPSTDNRTYPRIFPGFETFAGGAYDKVTGSTLAVFDEVIDGETHSFVYIVINSEDGLQDVVDMRAAVINR